MPKTVQIRDIDDKVDASLAKRAAEAGLTVPALLRRESGRLASRPMMQDWLERTRRRPAALTTADVMSALDERRERARELRDNLRAADALYVALAEALDATLLTLDERLARALGIRCSIEIPG